MSRSLPQVELPDGRRVFCLSRTETPVLFGHVQEYFKHGIEIEPGDIVFDVGANVGLFTMEAWDRCGPDGAVYAFEPIPAVIDALERNVERFHLEGVRALPLGLGRRLEHLTFTFYPRMTAVSTVYPEGWKEELCEIFVNNSDELPDSLRWLHRLPRFVRVAISRVLIEFFMKKETVRSGVTSISEALRELEVERIDLLKLDVEKSELDVLEGIAEDDWPKIRQVVAEVHDIDGRVTTVSELLENHGFEHVVVEQEAGYRNSNIWNFYARR